MIRLILRLLPAARILPPSFLADENTGGALLSETGDALLME